MGDNMKRIIAVLLLLISASSFCKNDSLLTFSEVMFNAPPGNNEFIEIYNLGSSQIVNLNGYKIKYYTSSADDIIAIDTDIILLPNSFAVILEGDYDLVKGIYNSQIPSSALILKIDNNSFGSSGMANTTDRHIYLLNSTGDTIDTYLYSANNNQGFSDEKIFPNKNNSQINWKNSICEFGTPGYKNSVSQKGNDLLLSSFIISPPAPVLNEMITINVIVKNIGAEPAGIYKLEIYLDKNLDSSVTQDEVIYSEVRNNLLSKDSSTFITTIQNLSPADHQLIAKVDFKSDEDTLNNVKTLKFTVHSRPNNYNDVVINEIMYAPTSNQPEWIELFNKTNSSINLKNCKFLDNSTDIIIATQDKYIPPQGFIILCKDTTIKNYFNIPAEIIPVKMPSLNNSGDICCIKNTSNAVLDSLEYLPTWGGSSEGKSLERVSKNDESTRQENWGTSKSKYKATPGRINSLTPKYYDLGIAEFKTEKDYGIIDEPVTLKIKIKNYGLNSSREFSVNIYQDINSDSTFQTNELLKSVNNESLHSIDSLVFDYPIQNFSIGENFFIAEVITAEDEELENNISFMDFVGVVLNETRNDLVINEIMYMPNSPEPEWIEIFNRSQNIIDFINYQLADASDTIKIINQSITLLPNDYLVVAKDSSIKQFYQLNSKIAYSNFPNLNNSSDKIILIDSLNRTIDSLKYSSHWGGSNGNSLERISQNIITTDSSNWMTSLSKSGGTPGELNSVVNLKGYERNSVVINEIMFDPATNNSEFVELLNLNNDSVDIGGWQLHKSENDYQSLSDKSFMIPNGQYFVFALDSTILENYGWMKYSLCSIANQSGFSLSAIEGKLVLKDAKRNTIDSVFYSSGWHNKNIVITKNKSLERINPQFNSNHSGNWSTAVNPEGATPGRSNSILTQNEKLEEKISVSPNPFSPDNDGFEDFTFINYNLNQSIAQVRIKIFDSQGRLIRTLLNNQASGSSGSLIFDGLNDAGNPLRIGIYIIFFEALNENSGVLETMKTVVVVARKL